MKDVSSSRLFFFRTHLQLARQEAAQLPSSVHEGRAELGVAKKGTKGVEL